MLPQLKFKYNFYKQNKYLLILGLFMLLMGTACNEGPEEVAADSNIQQSVEKTPRRIAIDVGIIVSDMEQSLVFYRDLLDLAVIAEVNTSLIGKGRMVQLQHGSSLIKLVMMEEQPTKVGEVGIAKHIGYRYMTLMVADLDRYLDKIIQAKIPVSLPLTELGNGARILMVEDPDGNIVEFVEEPLD